MYEKRLGQVLSSYNKFLQDNTFLSGYSYTIADIAMTNFLVHYYRYYLDINLRKKYAHLSRHFEFMI